MLTITTEKQTIYININLLKSRFKSAFITLLKVLTFLCAFGGFLIMLSGAGLHENNTITFLQAILRIIQGFLCCGVAWVLNFIKLVIEWRRISIYKLLYTLRRFNMSKYKYQSQITGEIVTSLKEVIKTFFEELRLFKIINWRWKYNKNGF